MRKDILYRRVRSCLLACSLAVLPAAGCGTQEAEVGPDESVVPSAIDVSVAQSDSLIRAGVTILDVRTPAEFGRGHIEGAVNIDYSRPGFREALDRLSRDRAYLVHCASGQRSRGALRIMSTLGFGQVYHMEEGYRAWVANSRPEED